MNTLCAYVREHGYDIRFASSPSPTSRAATSCCPTIGHALAFIAELDHPEMVGLNPEVGHEEMAGLNFAHGIAQALWHGKLFHIDLNGQHGPRFDQDLRFGAGNLRGAFWTVDALRGRGGPPPATTGPALRLQAAAHRGRRRGVGDRRACMRNYLILREKVRAFRADPEVQQALADAGRPRSSSEPTARARGVPRRRCGRVYDIEGLAER